MNKTYFHANETTCASFAAGILSTWLSPSAHPSQHFCVNPAFTVQRQHGRPGSWNLPSLPIIFKNGLGVGEKGRYISRLYSSGKKIGYFKIALLELKESCLVWVPLHWKCRRPRMGLWAAWADGGKPAQGRVGIGEALRFLPTQLFYGSVIFKVPFNPTILWF